jgi:RND family efflux transporter MFP subunit
MLAKAKQIWADSRLAQALRGPNRRKILMGGGIGLVLLLVIGTYSLLSSSRAAAFQSAASGDYITQPAEMGVLVEAIDATGIAEAGQLAVLTWQTTGIVEEVNVEEGEQVQRGDTLANLQLSSMPEEVISAQSELLAAQQELEEFYASYEGLALAEAQQAVADAQAALEDAQYTLNSLISTADDLAIANAEADMVEAWFPMIEAKQYYEKYEGKPTYNMNRVNALQEYYDAKSVYDAAVRTYNSLTGTGTATQIAEAEANVAVAEQTLAKAQVDYDSLLAGPTDEEILAAESKVAAAEANLKLGLIEAPFDGAVTLALPQVGDYVASGEDAFELQNTASYYVEVQVNELDINKVQVGQTATVVLDALQDVTYEAQVAKVGSIGDDSSGVVNFTVVVQIAEPDEKIKSGMTAVVSIEVGSGEEALLVPNEAVQYLDGQQIVYVLNNGVLMPVPVTIGGSSSTQSSVLDGDLQTGDLVVVNPPGNEVQTPSGVFFGGAGGPPDGAPDIQQGGGQ